MPEEQRWQHERVHTKKKKKKFIKKNLYNTKKKNLYSKKNL